MTGSSIRATELRITGDGTIRTLAANVTTEALNVFQDQDTDEGYLQGCTARER